MEIDDAVKTLITDSVLQKRLAKYLVLQCFRNSVLEDLHAGIVPARRAETTPMLSSGHRAERFPGVRCHVLMMRR